MRSPFSARRAKQFLFSTHRWLGVGACVFVVLWFVSGITMMYVGYPNLTPADRLSHVSPLARHNCCVPLTTAWKALPAGKLPSSIVLSNIGGRPVYQFALARRPFGVDGRTGTPLNEITPVDAVRAGEDFMHGSAGQYRGLVWEDVWSGRSSLNAHRPLHLVQMADDRDSLLYVSSATGEVLTIATRTQRRWNYVGAWLHWLYFFYTTSGRDTWRIVIMVTSGIGVLLSVTGIVIGLMRWRFSGRHKSGSKSPYRDPIYRWHHIVGLLFAAITLTWLWSGLMSVNPGGLFTSKTAALDMRAFAGGELAPRSFRVEAEDFLVELPAGFSARQIEWRIIDGFPYLVARDSNGNIRVRDASDRDAAQLTDRLPERLLVSAGLRLVPGATATSVTRIVAYDFYYYRSLPHTLYAELERPLPVIKLEFDDAARTWVYLDVGTGAITARVDDKARYQRWLFLLLHDWDLPALLEARPLRNILLLVFLLGGVALGTTGLVMAIRRVRFTLT